MLEALHGAATGVRSRAIDRLAAAQDVRWARAQDIVDSGRHAVRHELEPLSEAPVAGRLTVDAHLIVVVVLVIAPARKRIRP